MTHFVSGSYKLMLDLRHRCRYLRAGVVDYAKSAATLLMFGVDKIFMAPAAELGPLDAQIEHPTKEGLIVSALDVADSLESLGRTSMDLAISSGASIVQYTGLPRLDVLKVVTRYMERFLPPAIEKLDPHLIHQATNQLKIAERYAAIMLETRNLPEEEQISPEAARELVNRLVNDYPTHGFVISPHEARALGLPVVDVRSHPRWTKIKTLYDEFAGLGNSRLFVSSRMRHSTIRRKQFNYPREVTMRKSQMEKMGKPVLKRRRSRLCPERDRRLSEALDLMRGVVRSPLGQNPKRDEAIKAVWHSGSDTSIDTK